jgi:hypothetical protein
VVVLQVPGDGVGELLAEPHDEVDDLAREGGR